jgi:hypothetical protein
MTAKSKTNGTTPTATPEPAAALPEAPASASAKMISSNGIEWLLTTRDHTVNGLLTKVKVMEEHLLKDGWTPARNGYARSVAPTGDAPTSEGAAPVCPMHGTPMKASKHGKGFYCPQKIADDDGTGKPVYCKQTVK